MNLTPLSSKGNLHKGYITGVTWPLISTLCSLCVMATSTLHPNRSVKLPPPTPASCLHGRFKSGTSLFCNEGHKTSHGMEGKRRKLSWVWPTKSKENESFLARVLPWFHLIPSAGMKSTGCRQLPLFKAGQATERTAWAWKTLEKNTTQQAWNWHASQSWNKTGKKSHASLKLNRWRRGVTLRILRTRTREFEHTPRTIFRPQVPRRFSRILHTTPL